MNSEGYCNCLVCGLSVCQLTTMSVRIIFVIYRMCRGFCTIISIVLECVLIPSPPSLSSGWYGNLWWEKELPEGCTVQDMETVLSHSLSAVQYPLFSETETSSLGLVSTVLYSSSLLLPLSSIFLSLCIHSRSSHHTSYYILTWSYSYNGGLHGRFKSISVPSFHT